jgi:very-short-patch-repair endonuclease
VRIGSIPVTDATRTLLDLAAQVDISRLEVALDDALRRRLTSLPRLKWLLSTVGRGKKGSAILREFVAERCDNGPIPESVLETRLWKPLTRLGVPPPIKQHPVLDGRYRIDFAFPHAMVAVEAQSYTWHSSRASWERDIEKHNALTELGWTVIYLTWTDLREDPRGSIARLRDLLLPRFL